MTHFELLLLWYHVATGLSSFSNKTHSNIKAPKTLCSLVWILKISIALKQQPAFNCSAAATTTISDQKKAYILIFSIQNKHGKCLFVSVSIIVRLAYDISGGRENTTRNLGSCQKVILRLTPSCLTENDVWHLIYQVSLSFKSLRLMK